jgi:three-Cys-motif partner protein
VLKHGAYSRYLVPCVMKTGSTSIDNRFAIFDAFAGSGEYEDGSPGSPKLALRVADKLKGRRTVECHFVEKDPATFLQLQQNVAGASTPVKVYKDTAEGVLTAVLNATAGIPLFAFVDPYGLGLGFEALTNRLMTRAGRFEGQRGGDTTEILLNFNLSALARGAGFVLSKQRSASKVLAQVAWEGHLNRVLGGDWWKEIWVTEPKETRRHLIVQEYTRRIAETAGGWSHFRFGVSKGWKKPPIYVLIFLTRYPPALWLFNEAVSCAHEVFHDWCAKRDSRTHPQQLALDLAVPESDWHGQYIDAVRTNVETLIAPMKSFYIRDHVSDIYQDVLGYARERHVRAALKELRHEGRIQDFGTGDLYGKLIVPIRLESAAVRGSASHPKSSRQVHARQPSESGPQPA